jgi:GDP/UDP-N,N'-diacetylbacillosamine 2-epimerase (hydrolysing)
MKLMFLTGSRGEWGYIRPILRLCQRRGVEYSICTTNMHLLPSHGTTINEIVSDGFEVDDRIYMSLEGHNHFTMVKSLGVFLTSFIDVLVRNAPDWLVLAGDRGEQLMGAIAGSYTYTAVAHIQAGELSGNIDGLARHALGKFVHLHFAANHDAGERLKKLGEQEFRIQVVGAPQLDELVAGDMTPVDKLARRFDFNPSAPYFLVLQHPVTEELGQAERQIRATLEALSRFDLPKIWVMPNNDAGCDTIRDYMLTNRTGDTQIFLNLTRRDYLGLLRHCACIVGNSSSGLLEAPTFEVPAVNLGRRQESRLRGANVIDAPFESDRIAAAIERALSPAFRKSLKGSGNPYGDGRSSERILDILQATTRDDRLLIKNLTY